MSSPIDAILPRLEGVLSKGRNQYVAKCPSHDDKSPSLSVKEADDHRVLLRCHAGCGFREIIEAIDLLPRDLFPNKNDIRTRQKYSTRQLERSLLQELYVLQIAIFMRHDGEPVHPDDAGREGHAVSRILKYFGEIYE